MAKWGDFFRFVVARGGQVERFNLPQDHTDADLEWVDKVVTWLPRIGQLSDELSAASTDYMVRPGFTPVDPDPEATIRIPSQWFREDS